MSKKIERASAQETPVASEQDNQYRGLPRILHGVRWTQHLLAIVAEVLILVSFAMSGMDVSLSGVMTGIVWLKWAWGAAFALGIDTSFVIAWVRVRQCALARNWNGLVWNILLAVGMSFIVFQPVAIQLLQQAMGIGFNQALAQLGINLIILVYARAGVAVFLGAILAMTNVESAMKNAPVPAQAKRRLIIFDKVLNQIAPVMSDTIERAGAQIEQGDNQDSDQALAQIERTVITPVQDDPAKQIASARVTRLSIVPVDTELTPVDRVKQVLSDHPDCSDRELGRLSGLAPATAKKYKAMLNQGNERAG